MRVVRAAVHVHSDWSFDGTMDLPRILSLLRRRGYDAVLTAEHCQSLDEPRWQEYRSLCARLSTDDLLVVPGIEYRDAANVVHVPTWGDLPHLGDAVEVGSLLREVRDRGGAAVWAHPARRDADRTFVPEWADLLSGVEVWNRKYDGWLPSSPGQSWSQAHHLPQLASLDLHKRRQLFPLATEMEVARLDESSVVEALRAGRLRPTFLRQPVGRWVEGPRAHALAAADGSRRIAARLLRRTGVI